MKRMLINTCLDEIRVAIQANEKLYDLDIERPGYEYKVANIYKGIVTRVEPSLEAAFIDYGANRHGFLPLREVVGYETNTETSENAEQVQKHSISDLIKEGQEILVQVDKDERGNKGAALTTYISLAGCFLVLMPNNPKAGGVSRRIEGDERQELRDLLSQLIIPEDMGVIVRTAGLGRSKEELQWDLDTLLKQWKAIDEAYQEKAAPTLIYRDSDVTIRSIRDYLRPDVEEIIVDDMASFEKVKLHLSIVRPDYVSRVKLHEYKTPIFNYYQLEKQIESAFQRDVKLPSGGAIVIDYTEALVSVDINSSKDTKGGDIEETALNTNLEAADEIARQMRLRDLSGLIVIDFIDMTPLQNQIEVENRLREATKDDRARIQIGRISRFGLLEMSRQRLRPFLDEFNQVVCPRCNGRGTIRDIHSISSSILRLLEENAVKYRNDIQAELPMDVAAYLLNNRRSTLNAIEERYNKRIIIIPSQHIESPHYKITRTNSGHNRTHQNKNKQQQTYNFLYETDEKHAKTKASHEPAVKTVVPGPKPEAPKPSLLKRIWASLFSAEDNEKSTKRTHSSDNRRRHRSGGPKTAGNRNQSTTRRRNTGNRNNPRRTDTRSNDTRNTDTRRNDTRSNDTRSNDTRRNDTRNNDTRNNDTRNNDTRNNDTRNNDTRSNDTRSNDHSSGANDNRNPRNRKRKPERRPASSQGNRSNERKDYPAKASEESKPARQQHSDANVVANGQKNEAVKNDSTTTKKNVERPAENSFIASDSKFQKVETKK